MTAVDRHAPDEYLRDLREEYRWASKKGKQRLLDEAVKRTRVARKVVVRKLGHPAQLMPAVQIRQRAPQPEPLTIMPSRYIRGWSRNRRGSFLS